MIARIVLAVIVGVVVGLICLVAGGLLVDLKVSFAQTIGGFLQAWAWVIGLLAALWYFFAGGSFPGIR